MVGNVGRAKTEEQVSWNLSQKISEQIDTLLRGGRKNTIQGQHLNSFYMFKEIRLLINHHFKKGQLTIVDKLEKDINTASVTLKKLGSMEEGDDFEYSSDNTERNLKERLITEKNNRFLLIEKYRKLILNLLDDYGYLMERKTNSAFME